MDDRCGKQSLRWGIYLALSLGLHVLATLIFLATDFPPWARVSSVEHPIDDRRPWIEINISPPATIPKEHQGSVDGAAVDDHGTNRRRRTATALARQRQPKTHSIPPESEGDAASTPKSTTTNESGVDGGLAVKSDSTVVEELGADQYINRPVPSRLEEGGHQFRICFLANGKVHSVAAMGMTGACGEIEATLRRWRINPQNKPICVVATF